MDIKKYSDYQLNEAFDSEPYPFELEAKSTSMDRWYIITTPQGNYRMWFEVQKALGPKVMRVVLGQAAPQQKVYKKILQNFKDPMKVIATMFAALRTAIKDDQYVRVQDGLALAIPNTIGDRFESVIKRALIRALTGTPFEILNDNSVAFSNEEFDYLPIIKKGKNGPDVFKGKDVVADSDPEPAATAPIEADQLSFGDFKAKQAPPHVTPFFQTATGKADLLDLFDGWEKPTKAKLVSFLKKYGAEFNWINKGGVVTGIAKAAPEVEVGFQFRSGTVYKTSGRLRDPNGTKYIISVDGFRYQIGAKTGNNYGTFELYRGVGEGKYGEFNEKQDAFFQEFTKLGVPGTNRHSYFKSM